VLTRAPMGTRWFGSAVGLFLAITSSAGASPLSFRAALSLAHERAPKVLGAGRAAHGLTAAVDSADPLVALPAQLQVTMGARTFAGARAPGFETQAQFQQYVPLRPVGAARRDVMGAARLTALARSQEELAAVDERAARAWLAVFFAEKSLALHTRAVAEAKSLTELARARVASGLATPNETALALADEAMAETEQLDAEGQLTEAKLLLGSLVDIGPSDIELDDRDAPADVACPTFESALRAMNDRHPSLRRAREQGALAVGEASYVYAQHGSSLGVGFTAAHEGSGESLAAALVTVPLAWSSPGQADVLRARAEADELSAIHTYEHDELVRDLRVALHEHEHTRATHAASLRAVSALEDAYRIARAWVERGAADLSVAALARQRLILGEDRAIHARAAVYLANVRLLAAQGLLHDGVTR
jgi:cobalt-zinc-cadmium efflux system outer membrane protein